MSHLLRPRVSVLPLILLLAACGKEQAPGNGSPASVETACGNGADDDGDGQSDCADLDCRTSDPACELAPKLDRSVATTVDQAAEFLYSGPDPLQKGAKASAFDRRRAAILRGKVVDRDGEPLAGVRVSVVDHAELGHTLTRPDGLFDLAVNGGARLMLRYDRDGYLTAERSTQPGWQRYARLPEVGMVEQSGSSTVVRALAQKAQTALGDAVSDDFGERQPFVFFRAGTGMNAELPGGKEERLGEISLHVTEYPFELPSAERWVATARFAPGTLPVGGGINYGLEIDVAEAEDLGAKGVSLTSPASIYVENFLGLKVGSPVPLGYYDRGEGQWQRGSAGRVIGLVDVVDGVARVDLDGDDVADDETALRAAGFVPEELAALGARYSKGATLWRASVKHFSPWDMLFPVGAPGGATAPSVGGVFSRPLEVPSRRGPSVVEPQALAQTVPIAGTPYSLHYQTDRTSGYGPGFQIELPLLGDDVPEGLNAVISSVEIAGQLLEETLTPEPGLERLVVWNGKDGFGREVQGPQTARIVTGFVFDGELAVGEGFGLPGASDEEGLDVGDAVLSQVLEVPIGVWDAKGYALGGFGLDVLHAYDPAHQTVFFGWGDLRTAQNVALVATRPSSESLGTPDSVAVAPDGSLIVTDDQQDSETPAGRILRITPDGATSVVAGAGAQGDAGSLSLGSAQGVVVRDDGTVIVSDAVAKAIRAIGPDGSVSTLMGPASESPVVVASLQQPDGLALGPREELYVADTDRVLRLEGGKLDVFAGGGATPGGDGLPATEVVLDVPSAIVVAPDGTVFISERGIDGSPGGHKVRKVTPSGIILPVAGTGTPGFSGDGGSAQLAELSGPRGLALAADGSLYIADQWNDRIRRVTPDGIIQTVMGGGDADLEEGQLAERVQITEPDGIAVGSDGALFVAALESVFRVAPGMPEISANESLVPSTDGTTLFRFDERGRHRETIDAMTGVTELTFGYDKEGRVITLTDKDGLVTKIDRDSDGRVEAFVAPFGQKTSVELDDRDRIEAVTDPIDRETKFEYRGELIEATIDPVEGRSSFDYDAVGFLKSATDPTGYSETYERAVTPTGYAVSATSGSGRLTEYGFDVLPGGIVERSVRLPDGKIIESSDTLITRTQKDQDGSTTTTLLLPDPAFGAQSLFPGTVTTKLPGGQSVEVAKLRAKRLTDIKNALSVEEWDELTELNGRVLERLYLRADRTLTTTTPMGRTTTVTLDDRGRQTDVTAPGLPAVHFEYDDSGRLRELTTTADGEVRRQLRTYGDSGFLAATEDAEGNVTRQQADLVGRIERLFRPDDEVVSLAYDRNDNLSSLTPPGRDAHTFRYLDGTDLLELVTPPLVDGDGSSDLPVGGARSVYDDGAGRDRDLLSIQRADGQNIDFGYDEATGRLRTIDIPQATISYGYDAGGTISSINRSDSVKVTMTHDGPLWTGSTWSGAVQGSVTAKYDANLFLTSMTVNAASTAKFTYDDDGLMLSATANAVTLELERDPETGFVTDTTLGTVTTAQDYNGFGELSRLRSAFQGVVGFTQELERDALGRVTGIKETIGTQTREIDYAYDSHGRLSEETVDGVNNEVAYDENGNITSLASDGEPTEATYDAQDRLTNFGDNVIEQTAQGDLLRISRDDRAVEFEYDPLGNLLSVTQSDPEDTRVISYKVDGLGRRVARQIDGQFDTAWFYRDALRPVGQIDAQGVFMHFIYADGAGGAPDFILRAGVPYRVIKDHRGSVRLVINAQTGVVEQVLDYDAHGRVIEDTNAGFQPFGFAGGIDDPFTGLVRFGRRDYNAKLGRWMAKDPSGFSGGDTNLYAYCFGDPVNRVDPDGRRPLSAKERAFLKKYLGGSIDLNAIDVDVLPAPLAAIGIKGMNPYGSKLLLHSDYFKDSDPAKEVNLRRVKASTALAHEAFHVWQRAYGTQLNVTIDGLALPVGRLFGISPYAYEASTDPHEMYLRFLMGGIEQQAAMFEHYVLSDLTRDKARKDSLAEIAAYVLTP